MALLPIIGDVHRNEYLDNGKITHVYSSGDEDTLSRFRNPNGHEKITVNLNKIRGRSGHDDEVFVMSDGIFAGSEESENEFLLVEESENGYDNFGQMDNQQQSVQDCENSSHFHY